MRLGYQASCARYQVENVDFNLRLKLLLCFFRLSCLHLALEKKLREDFITTLEYHRLGIAPTCVNKPHPA